MDPAIEEIMLRPAGHPHAFVSGTRQQRPILEIVTPRLDLVLANVPLTGLATADDSYVYFKQAATSGVSAATARATTSHKRVVVSQLVAYWTRISLPHRGQATVALTIAAVYDGTNNPLVPAGSVALSGNLAAGKEYGCGPASVTVSGPTTTDLEPINIDIQSGAVLSQEGDASNLWDSFVGVRETDPTVEITSLSKLSLTEFGLQGSALDGSTGLVCYGRKTGPRVSDATTDHVKFVATDGTAFPGRVSTSDGRWTDTVRIKPIAPDDTTQPLVISTGVAIT